MQIHNTAANALARTYTRQAGAPEGVAGQAPPRGPQGRPRTDTVALSPSMQELTRVRAAVENAPDVRADRVAALKAQIAGGTYKIEDLALAAKLLG